MNKTDAIHFIINKLIVENKFEKYFEWFKTIQNKNIKFHNMDKEYEKFTNIAIILYVRQYIPDMTIDQIWESNFEFLYFVINRERMMVSDEFYKLFIDEVENYDNSVNTLK
jgi:hypothetical protein